MVKRSHFLLFFPNPFCFANKNVMDCGKVLYALYGIVEHSGSMRGGHYAAYVKVRNPSQKNLEHISSNKNVQGTYLMDY